MKMVTDYKKLDPSYVKSSLNLMGEDNNVEKALSPFTGLIQLNL